MEDDARVRRQALGYCLKAINKRLHSSHELAQALARKEVPQPVIAGVLEELSGFDLVNDERFAKAWVRGRDSLRPRGPSVLQMELMQKGIPKDLIRQVLADRKEAATDPDSEQPTDEDLAKEVVRRKERQYAHLDPETRKRRLIALLMRRGFSYDVARRILS